MRKGTTNVRMYLHTYKKIRQSYPPLDNVSAAKYFHRLAKWLQGVMAEWDGLK